MPFPQWSHPQRKHGALVVDGVFATRFLRRLEYGVRQGLAVGIACIWVLIPTFAGPLSSVAFLAVVLALISTGENFGRTVHNILLCLLAAVVGALLVVAWHAAVGTSYGASWGGVALFSFILTYPRFSTLFIRIAQVINVSGLITYHLNPTLPWYFPFQTAGACAIGCGCALVALILPYPRAASAEAKARLGTAARISAATFSSLVESYTADSDERATVMQVQAAYLLQSADVNLSWLGAVLPDLPWELWVRRGWISQVAAYMKLVKELTACLKGMHRAVTDWDIQHAAHNPMKSKMVAALRQLGECSGNSLGREATLLRKMQPGLARHEVGEEAPGERGVDEEVLQFFQHELQLAREYAYYREPYMENGQLVYPTVPLWGMLASSFFLFHAYKYACIIHKAQAQLKQQGGVEGQPAISEHDEEQEEEEEEDFAAQAKQKEKAVTHKGSDAAKAGWRWVASLWAPDADKFKEAVRRTAALICAGIVGLALSNYGLWAAIAAAFVGGQRIGGSFNTGLGRLQGSVAGAVAGFLLLLATRKVRAMVGVTLALWVVLTGYVRTNAAHGYSGLVGGFTAIVIMLGQPPQAARATLETYAFTRLYEQCIGILFVVFFDYALWPARAVKLIQRNAVTNLTKTGELWSLLLRKYLDAGTVECRIAAIAEITALEANIAACIEYQKQLAKDAAGEPQLWHAPFAAAPWQALIAGQAAVLGLMGTIRRTMTVRSNEVLAEQMKVLVQPLRPQLEVLGQEIGCSIVGLLVSLGGSPDPAPPQKKASRWAVWRKWGNVLRHRKAAQPSGTNKEQSESKANGTAELAATKGAEQQPNGIQTEGPPAANRVPLEVGTSGTGLGRRDQSAESTTQGGAAHESGQLSPLGSQPARVWSMPHVPHLTLNISDPSAQGPARKGRDAQAPQSRPRFGGNMPGTRSEGNTPRVQQGRRLSASYTQRLIDEINVRLAAVERDEQERAERARERRTSVSHDSTAGGGDRSAEPGSARAGTPFLAPHASPFLRTTAAGLEAAPGVSLAAGGHVEVVVVRGGDLEMAQQSPAIRGSGQAAEVAEQGRYPTSSSSSSDESSHSRRSVDANPVSTQGGTIPDLAGPAQSRRAEQPVGAGEWSAAEMERSQDTATGSAATGEHCPGSVRAEAPPPTLIEEEEWADDASGSEGEGGAGEMGGPTLRERRQRALSGLQRRYEAIIQGLLAAKRAEPQSPLLSSEALLHFNALVYSIRLLIWELEKMEKAVTEVRQMSRPIRLGTIAELPYDVAARRKAAFDEDPVTVLLDSMPPPSAVRRQQIEEGANEGKEE